MLNAPACDLKADFRKVSLVITLAGLFLTTPVNVWGQAAGKEVVEIRVVGNKTLTDAYIIQQLKHVHTGRPATLDDIRKDTDNLKLTGKFADVFATTEDKAGKWIVIFHVMEKPLVRTIVFEGAKKFKDKDLLKVLQFSEGDALDRYTVQAGADAIAEKYREEGFTDVSVTIDDQALTEGDVVYRIIEGPRVRVRKILFEGNQTFSANRLRGQIETKTYFWLIRQGAYSEKQIQEDIVSLRNFYRAEGFLDAQVGRRLEFSPDRQDLTVTFVIQEGLRYTVGKIKVTGNREFDENDVLGSMQLSPGSILNLDVLEGDKRSVRDMYNQGGFIYAKVDIAYAYADTPGTADLTVTINEGKSYKIGRIIVRGNRQTQDRVVRRTLDFYPGDTFDAVKMRDQERRLYETRLFREASIRPIGEEPDTRDALIEVEETETTRLMAGVGVTSNSGLIGTISIENWNFDLFDWPRTLGEFLRGQAFKGAGQTLRLSIEPGTELTRLRIDFREPYLFDRPISLGWSAYLFQRDRDGYDETRAGTILSLGKRFKKIYAFNTAFRFEGIEVDDIDEHFVWWKFWNLWQDAPADILEVEGWNFLTSLKLSLVRDTTDSFFMPTRGTRMEASWEQAGLFGGDFDFAKLIGQATHYETLREDVFGRKTVWASNVLIGYTGGDTPVFERFYGGGIGSIRGFEFRGISPRQDPGDTQVGGEFELLVGNELSFPVVGKNLRGVVFLDMGTVEEDVGITDWRAAVGFGLRLVVDYFGPIPMSFDFAWPIAEGDDDDTQVFSFSLGATFK